MPARAIRQAVPTPMRVGAMVDLLVLAGGAVSREVAYHSTMVSQFRGLLRSAGSLAICPHLPAWRRSYGGRSCSARKISVPRLQIVLRAKRSASADNSPLDTKRTKLEAVSQSGRETEQCVEGTVALGDAAASPRVDCRDGAAGLCRNDSAANAAAGSARTTRLCSSASPPRRC